MNSANVKTALLCFEAKRWIGTVEEGPNGGQIVEMFQRAVDGHARNESWCMAFAQYCILMTERLLLEVFPNEPHEPSSIFRSEHCLTVWNRSRQLQIQTPEQGALCIWQRFNGREATSNGHAGIVTDVHSDGSISIVEGNARDPERVDGVWLRRYSVGQLNHGALRIKGFLRVW